jgi:hypothetical protein
MSSRMDFQLDRTVEILRSTPATLRALLGDVSDPWIRCDEGPDTWSPYDIVGHMIHGEKTDWIGRMRRLAAKRWLNYSTRSKRCVKRTCGL